MTTDEMTSAILADALPFAVVVGMIGGVFVGIIGYSFAEVTIAILRWFADRRRRRKVPAGVAL